jgi:hypothetical protein
MATSNNTTWEVTVLQMITRAYAKIGIPGEGNALTAPQLADGLEALNSIIALAVTDGMPLWKRLTTFLTPSLTNQVYNLPSAAKVAEVFLLDDGGTQWELGWKSLYDFNQLPTDTQSVPVYWTFQPLLQGGTISFWPLKSDATTVSTKTIKVVYQREFDGAFSLSETLDFPAYWTLALVYQTAVQLAPEHGVPIEDRRLLIAEADKYWAQASDYGDEDGSIFIQPERRR